MAHPDVIRVLTAGAINGESPAWSVAESKLYWADTKGATLHAFDPASGTDEHWRMPAWIGCFALAERGVVIALRTGLYAFDRHSGALQGLAGVPYDCRRFTFNDGGCDRQGRFFVGPMYSPLEPGDQEPQAAQTAPLWRYDGAGRWVAVSQPVKISNGLAWSPDGRTLYHCDTPTRTIWAHDYDVATGAVENPRVFARVEEGGGEGGPDGAAVDRDGFYTCAVYGAGCLLRFDPDGKLERRIALPARYVTMPAFGGADLRTLYVTSAAFPLTPEERARQPDEGAVFALEAPAPGLAASHFRAPPDAAASPAPAARSSA